MYNSSRTRTQKVSAPTSAPPLGALLSRIEKSELFSEATKFKGSAAISDCEFVASFNWLDSAKPVIVVPGKPPAWTPPKHSIRLREDSGDYPRDKNAFRYPDHPYEAAVLSILAMQPKPPSVPFDIVCCSSTLGNLLSYCNETEPKPFRALVEVVGGAMHVIRREKSPKELIEGVRGYGHSFPEAYTTWDLSVAGSASHQRIMRYQFAGLNILLRAEIDGYFPDEKILGRDKTKSLPATTSVNDLIKGMSTSAVAGKMPDGGPSKITIRHGGSVVPQSSLFDLKTRSSHAQTQDILGQQVHRLWRSQIPNFVLAFHARGNFFKINTDDVTEDIKVWERSHRQALAMLAVLLRRLMAEAASRPDKKMEIRVSEPGFLEIHEQLPDAGEVFSKTVRERWEAWLGLGQDGDPGSHEESKEGSESDTVSTKGKEKTHRFNSDDRYDKYDEAFGWDDSDDGAEKDYTACSADHCGYCGECSY